jgi:hypothetical protein
VEILSKNDLLFDVKNCFSLFLFFVTKAKQVFKVQLVEMQCQQLLLKIVSLKVQQN